MYGYLRQGDVGHTAAGGELFPMYELEIRNSENEVMKTYSADQIYISDVFIEENMMTLNRVVNQERLIQLPVRIISAVTKKRRQKV